MLTITLPSLVTNIPVPEISSEYFNISDELLQTFPFLIKSINLFPH
jgi:hypothetical protein